MLPMGLGGNGMLDENGRVGGFLCICVSNY